MKMYPAKNAENADFIRIQRKSAVAAGNLLKRKQKEIPAFHGGKYRILLTIA